MTVKLPNKEQIIKDFQINEKDCGSPDVQVAILTQRIKMLTEHLKEHKKDFHTRRGLWMMVGKRRRLLNYIAKNDYQKYRDLISRLGLRR